MVKLGKNRADVIARNAEASKRALRDAAEAKARGDIAGMKRAVAAAANYDKVAQEFASGANDDLLENP